MSSPNKKSRTEAAAAEAKPAAATQVLRAVGQYRYMTGWQTYAQTEVLEGAIPAVGNTPQKCPYGLYAEQINGTSFTKAKHANLRTWQYRIRPSASINHDWKPLDNAKFHQTQAPTVVTPESRRWKPLPMPKEPTMFFEGLHAYAGAGAAEGKAGLRCCVYACNKSMVNCSYSSSDGDMLLVPQVGTLDITSEMGRLEVPSGFIAVMPRGVKFSVAVPAEGARGYVCEVFDGHFETPPMGVIGANGLSNLKDFEIPVAHYEDKDVKWTHYQKFNELMFSVGIDHSPFNVVAWSGNYYPFRYDLSKYCVINTVSFDHLDPSIFCVLTAQTGEPGVASCDFVIFPPRWMVATDTFRPPYYHQNTMSEFMGNVAGTYEAKPDGGFQPGGVTLHNTMTPHGPAVEVFEKASNVELKPGAPMPDTMAFMFESTYMMKLTPFAAENLVDREYADCWKGFKKHFTPNQK